MAEITNIKTFLRGASEDTGSVFGTVEIPRLMRSMDYYSSDPIPDKFEFYDEEPSLQPGDYKVLFRLDYNRGRFKIFVEGPERMEDFAGRIGAKSKIRPSPTVKFAKGKDSDQPGMPDLV